MKLKEERTYNVPLRSEWLKVPRWRRTKRAVAALRKFLIKHTKTPDVRLSRWINEAIWVNGAKNPPHHLKVKVTKLTEKIDTDTFEYIDVELTQIPKKAERIEKKKKAILDKLDTEIVPKKAEEKESLIEKVKKKVKKKVEEKPKGKSVKELQKEAQEAEKKKAKKQAVMTKAQERRSKK